MTKTLTLGCFALLAFHTVSLQAQAASEPRRQDRQLTLDVNALGAGITFANRLAGERGTFMGFGLGVGGDLMNYTLLGGRHFAQDGFASYEGRDAAGGEALFELAHVKAFGRCCDFNRWQIDYGLRVSGFLHSDDSDDDPGGAWFVGADIHPTWGTRRFRFGPRVLVGRISENSRPELIVNLSLITGRVVFGW